MPPPAAIRIAPARSIDDIDTARGLFREYINGLGIDLSFQDVDDLHLHRL